MACSSYPFALRFSPSITFYYCFNAQSVIEIRIGIKHFLCIRNVPLTEKYNNNEIIYAFIDHVRRVVKLRLNSDDGTGSSSGTRNILWKTIIVIVRSHAYADIMQANKLDPRTKNKKNL